MRRLLATLSALALTATAAADGYQRQPGVDALHYTFRLSLRDETDEIEAEATVLLGFVDDGPGSFRLDLATPSTPGGRGMTVASVTSGGRPLEFSHQANRLEVTLPEAPKAGERRAFEVRYRGVPAEGLRIGPNRHGERTFFSNNWPDRARHWLPTIDHPYDKATSEFIVTAPSRYQVVSNGLLVEETDLGDGRRVTHWKQSVPIATWLNALGVARFTSHHAGTVRGVPLETWVHPNDRRKGLDALEGPTRRAVDFYVRQIGEFPYEKLGVVQAAGTDGGMEHASAIFVGEGTVDRGSATSLVAHEVAHQWFGDSVTEQDWDDVWLSEGFATYFAMRFIEHEEGREAFVAALRRARSRVFAAEERAPRLAVIHTNPSDTSGVLNDLVYQKGGWVLHMLRGRVGDDPFTAGVRKYYATYRDKNATTDDFRRVMEGASGQDLAWFFRQWLNRPGHPVIEGDWRYDAAAKSVVVDLAQTQPGDPYRLPLELGLWRGDSPEVRTEKVEMDQRRQQFRIQTAEEPSRVALDPNGWTLMESRLGKR
jgi:aminopeptidase N